MKTLTATRVSAALLASIGSTAPACGTQVGTSQTDTDAADSSATVEGGTSDSVDAGDGDSDATTGDGGDGDGDGATGDGDGATGDGDGATGDGDGATGDGDGASGDGDGATGDGDGATGDGDGATGDGDGATGDGDGTTGDGDGTTGDGDGTTGDGDGTTGDGDGTTGDGDGTTGDGDGTTGDGDGTTGDGDGTTGDGDGATGDGDGASGDGDGASGDGDGDGDGALDLCTACMAAAGSGALANPEIAEASGLARSLVHDGVFWVHNDSGDSARVFAIDQSGADRGTFDINAASAVDWEDAAIGPCPAGSCLYIGDFGDNNELRPSYTVYRVPEPDPIDMAGSANAEALPFVYPDGSHNAETLLVDEVTGEIVVVTKVFNAAASVYRFPTPLTPGVEVVLESVGTVATPAFDFITGGDAYPGAGVLLRSYGSLRWYPDAGDIASTLAGVPCSVPVASETQGETVAWLDGGQGWLTVSEGVGVDVNRTSCG